MEEGVEVLKRAWTEDRVTFHGKHWQLDGIPVYPKPRTQPHPPLAFAVGSPESLAWAGTNGYPIMSSGLFTPLDTTLKQREAYLTAVKAAGHSDTKIAELMAKWVVTKHVYVAPTDAEARADAQPAEEWFLDAYARSIDPTGLVGVPEPIRQAAEASAARARALTWDGLVDECLLVGSPETVRRKALELRAAGVGELGCWMNFGGIAPAKARRSMQLFADEVMPALR
jgi:alkanesulfonate monooxygenase SsuD/methylene tetrahydromethanopterin reductase-like flavin-dependent oxidoreductase (luciferase family)